MIRCSTGYSARTVQDVFLLECPLPPGVSDTLILLTDNEWHAASPGGLKTKP